MELLVVVYVLLLVRFVIQVSGVKVIWDMDDCITVGFVGKKEVVGRCIKSGVWDEHDSKLAGERVNKVMWCVYMLCMVWGVYNVVLSARGDNNRELTVAWMRRRGMVCDEMVLRTLEYEGVRSAEYKKMMVEKYGWSRVLVCVDDDVKNVAMFREMGMRGVVYGKMEVDG